MKRLIMFLLRKKLGVKKDQRFQFNGQKSDAVYYISDEYVMKHYHGRTTTSNVSINWLLDDECDIIPM
jgi:hypothetical protein